MASNGYVRSCCTGCIFYTHDREYGEICLVKSTGLWDWDNMKWVSWLDYEKDKAVAEAHDAPCEHHVALEDVRQQYRQQFGFTKDKA